MTLFTDAMFSPVDSVTGGAAMCGSRLMAAGLRPESLLCPPPGEFCVDSGCAPNLPRLRPECAGRRFARRLFHLCGDYKPAKDEPRTREEHRTLSIHFQQPAADHAAQRKTDRLRGVVHAGRRPFTGSGRQFRYQRGLRRLENIEAKKVHEEDRRDTENRMRSDAQ